MKTDMVTCKNCEKAYEDSFQFCPHCGQKTDDELTMGVLFYNTISNYFSFDARFFKSYLPLMLRPGYLANKFIEGKRLLYLHPAQMYLFISVVFFFLFSIITRDAIQEFDTDLKKGFDSTKAVLDTIQSKPLLDSVQVQELSKTLKNNNIGLDVKSYQEMDSLITSNKDNPVVHSDFNFGEKNIDSLIAAGAPDPVILKAMGLNDDAGAFKKKLYRQALKFYKQRSGGSILQAFFDSIPIAMFILLPIFALLLKLFYFKKGRFAHHLVFTFYFFSFLFMVFSILILGNLIFQLSSFIMGMVMLSTFFYLMFAVKNFYKQGYFLSFIKSSLVSFLFLSFVIPLAAIIIGLSAFLFY